MEIIPLEMSDGDPGYFVRGHVDKGKFISTVNAEFEEHFEPDDARHIYQTSVQPFGAPRKPDQYSEGDNFWWQCKPDDEAAFACTFVRP